MRRILVLLVATLAGCVQTSPVEPAADASPTDEARPDPTFTAVATGPAAGPDLNATTAAPPRLVPGEWWRIKFESRFFEDAPEFIRVVAAAGPEGYVIGMPHEGWFKEAIAYHSPAFGDIGPDLSYELHNVRFEPLRFPLTQGATWETAFGPTKLVATVERADEVTATIRFDPVPGEKAPTDPLLAALDPTGGNSSMRLVYDARQHEVTEFTSIIGTWKVLGHGYAHPGWVTIPRGLHTAIDHGQFLPATPGAPLLTRTQDIQGGYNRLTLMHGIFALGPGVYRIRDTGPDGKTYLTETIATKQSLTIKFHEATDPDGKWTLEDLAGGPGGTYTMGMAYHQYDIHLPDGARRGDHAHGVMR